MGNHRDNFVRGNIALYLGAALLICSCEPEFNRTAAPSALSSGSVGSSAGSVVTAMPAQKLAFTTQPSSTGTVLSYLSTQPIVSLEDVNGNVVTAATNAITLAAYTDSACTVPVSGTFSVTTNPVTAVLGVATFSGVTYAWAQTIYLGATSPGLTSACSTAITFQAGWTTTGSLSNARAYHTATLLPNGKVLVAGGQSSAGPLLASSELYDDVAGTWSVTGSLNDARMNHTATQLPNGKTLVAGGYDSGDTSANCETYDYTTGTWSVTGLLNDARESHIAMLLPNGKVLVAGGQSSAGPLASSELYDYTAGTWAVTGSLNTAREYSVATLLPNGKVLIEAGDDGVGFLSSSELYDYTAGTWSATGSMSTARENHTSTLLPNGKVLVSSGYNGTIFPGYTYLTTSELYDYTAGTWSATGSLNTGRSSHTATLLPNGNVLVAGGYNSGSTLNSSEIYDFVAGTWSTTGSMNTSRGYHTATLLPNNTVLVTGGYDGITNLAASELYYPGDAAPQVWSSTGSLSTMRDNHTATLLPNGKVLVAGGFNGGYLTSSELYDETAGTWSATGSMSTAREIIPQRYCRTEKCSSPVGIMVVILLAVNSMIILQAPGLRRAL